MHDYHGEPGYSPNQILHDGCGECEARALSAAGGLSYLDKTNVARAWVRAAQWNRGELTDIAHAEIPLLNTLWAVQVQLENFGVPIGQLPRGTITEPLTQVPMACNACGGSAIPVPGTGDPARGMAGQRWQHRDDSTRSCHGEMITVRVDA